MTMAEKQLDIRDALVRMEGNSAGFLGLPRDNPYRRGIYNPEAAALADEWEVGYEAGEMDAKEIIYQKRLAGTR
jgi:hypothetical protein